MKKKLFSAFLIFSFSFLILPLANAQTWVQKANFGGVARSSSLSFSIGTKGYIGSGYDGTAFDQDFWEWDQTSNVWTQKANFGGTARSGAVSFSIGTKGYAGTGWDGSVSHQDFWEWDQATNVWTQKANFGGTARYAATGFSIGTKGYIGTGNDGANKNDFWEFDPANTTNGNDIHGNPMGAWTVRAAFPGTARKNAAGFSIGTKGYIGTGNDGADKKDFYEYDQSANTWTAKASFGGTARRAAAGFSIGTKGYIGTGYDGADTHDFWEWNQATNVWTQKANFGGTARDGAVGFSIGTKGYIGTGALVATYKQDFWEYGPSDFSSAQLCFSTATNFGIGTGTAPRGICNADFNNDGNIDLATADNSSGNIAVLLGNGAGSFTFDVNAGVGSGPRSICSADFNKDGKMDLVVADNSAAVVAVILGNGDGTFQSSVTYATGSNPISVICADFNGDGNTDLATANNGSNNVTVLFGNGAGGFPTTNNYPTAVGGSPSGITCGYFDADSYLDLAVGNASTGNVSILIGTSSGTFGTPTNFSANSNPAGIINADFNGDGNADLAVNCANCSNVYVLLGNGNGTFGSSTAFPVAGTNYGLCSGDFNVDGKIDLATATTGTDNISVLQSNGDGTFQTAINFSTPATGTPMSVCSGDFNGDGKPDLAAANSGTNNVSVLLNTFITGSTSETNVSCNAGNNGSATITVAAGSSPYTYSWNTSPTQVTQTATGLSATNYSVTVTNTNGCTATASVAITQPAAISFLGAWNQKTNFGGTARYGAVGFSIGTKGYIGTGYDGIAPNRKDFWEWDQATNIWTQKADFGGAARNQAVGFSIGTKGYIGTGSAAGIDYQDFWEWDQASNVWSQKSNFGGGIRHGAVGFSIGIKGYISTGSDVSSNTYVDLWEWNQATDTWTKKADFGGALRAFGAGFSIGAKAYIGLGQYSSLYQDFWEWDQATNAWTQKANFSGTARSGASGFSIGTKGYLGTGYDGTVDTQDFWEWDQASNAWTQKQNFGGGGRSYGVAFSIGSKGYLGTGGNGSNRNDFWEYSQSTLQTNLSCNGGGNGSATVNPGGGTPPYTYSWNTSPVQTTQTATGLSAINYNVTITDANNCVATNSVAITQPTAISLSQTWTQKQNFAGTGRYGSVSFSIGTKGYIGTGTDGTTRYKDFWEWDQATNVWTQKANVGTVLREEGVGFSIGAKGYIGTGYDGSSWYNDFWEYNPSNNTWTAKTNFPGAGRYYSVGLSIGTKGYIGTGIDAGGTKYNDFYEYDPGNNTWTAKTNFPGVARYGCAGFSIGAKGYVGTGQQGATLYQDFYEYDQTNNTWTAKANFGGTGRMGAVGFSIGTKGYIGTGSIGPYTNDFWEWDQLNNTWASKANFGGTTRYLATGFSIGANGYIGTGYQTASPNNAQDFWEYSSGASQTNVSCKGNNTGSATVNPSGGTSPYTYSWNTTPAQTTQTATGLIANNYVATITDASGCTATTTVAITQPAQPLSVSTFANTTICSGSSVTFNGTVATGGTPNYNYNWSPATNLSCTTCASPIASPTGGVNYTVTATDANNCTAIASVSVTVNSIPAAPTASSNSPVNAGNTLSLTANTISGATYSWLGPNTFSSASQNPTLASVTTANAGNYSVTATVNGCTGPAGTTSVVVTANTFSITTSTTSVSCNGGNDGAAAVVSVSGGTGPYTYSWNSSPVQTTQAAFNLTSGNYTVTITDALGASAIATVNIAQPSAITVFTNPTNVSCYSGNNGKAQAIAGGGTSPYAYSWNSFPVQTTATASNLAAGNYIVTVTDANSCTHTGPVTITQPAVLTVSMTIVNTDCGSSNGSATANTTGGTASYSYLWNTAQTTQTISNAAAANYSLTITDAKGCMVNSIANIGTKPSNFNLAFSGTPQNGPAALPVTFTNSTPNLNNYNFTWYYGDGSSANNNSATVFYTYNFAGTYDVALIATDKTNGCKDTLAKAPYINVTGTGCGYTVSVTPSGPINKCQGDSAVLTASTNAVAPFTYQWNIGSVAISGANSSTFAVTQGGYYSVTVIKNNCPVTSSAVQVNFTTNPQQPVITSAGNIVPCLGGSVTLTSSTVNGATYSWNTTPVQTTQSIIVSSSGNYVVTAINGAGCTSASAPFTVNASLAQVPICLVTVDTVLSQNNIIVWDKPANAPIDSFIVYREISTNVYKPIGRVPYDSLSLFVDTVRTKYFPNTGNPNAGTYRYKIAVRDTCGNYSPMSLYHNTIYIINNSGTFFWPQLYTIENSSNPVTNYVLMRDDNSTGIWQQVQSVAGTQQTVTDPQYSTYQNTASWRVQTQWNISCAPTIVNPKNPEINSINLNSSRSNVYRFQNPLQVINTDADMIALVYPNPSSGIFTIDLKNNISGSAIIKVFNVMGEEVKRYNCVGCSNKTTMDLSKLAQGVYYLQIATAEKTITKKIIIE